MKKRKLTLAAIVAVVVAAFALVWSRPTGPTYEGKSVAQWFKLYRNWSFCEREDARDAFKALGDQAAPYLLSVLTRPQLLSRLKTSYAKFQSKLPPYLKRVLPGVSIENTARRAADDLLWAIRPSAKVLMPGLQPWLSSPNHPRYLLAVSLLGTIGDGASEAVPFLVQALQSTNQNHRRFAVQSLQNLGADARAAVPALIGALDDPVTRYLAIRVLRNIGPEAKAAIPPLQRLLDSPRRSEALAAAATLHQINPEGNTLRLLIAALDDPSLRLPAISHLGELGPAAMPALDLLLEALRTEGRKNRAGGPEWTSVTSALRSISPTNRAAISILLQKLKDARGIDRLNIAAELVRFDPAEPHGLEVLVEMLRPAWHSGVREAAAYALRQAGPGARAAIPALKAALNDKHEGVRRAAASALRKIEPASAE